MTKEKIIKSLQPLFEKAQANNLWFYSSYQEMWFSPGELKQEQSEGRFIWSRDNWTLRNPLELIESLDKEIGLLTNKRNAIKQKLSNQQPPLL